MRWDRRQKLVDGHRLVGLPGKLQPGAQQPLNGRCAYTLLLTGTLTSRYRKAMFPAVAVGALGRVNLIWIWPVFRALERFTGAPGVPVRLVRAVVPGSAAMRRR
jgi:hypothetical protein